MFWCVFSFLLRGRISSVSHLRRRIHFWLTGKDALDTTDSRPLHASYEARRTPAPPVSPLGELPEDSFYGSPYDSSGMPLASISRAIDGRFVLDKDSEEGGFTSPRKPIRSLATKKTSLSSYSRRPWPFIKWVNKSKGNRRVRQLLTLPPKVEGGVYDVRTGTTHPLVQHEHFSPRLSFRRAIGSPGVVSPRFLHGAVDFRDVWQAQYPFQSVGSPEFGRHVIPESPGSIATSLAKQRRVRSSSPRPYVDEWSQLAHLVSFSDEVSSVRQPSSVERSFPSTVLSSFQSSAQKTPSAHGTPLNAASLLQESASLDYDRFLREQEALRRQELQQLSVIFRDQALRAPSSGDARVYAPYSVPQPFIHRATGRLYYPEHYSPWTTPQRPTLVARRAPSPHHVRFRGPRSPFFHPPYREPFIYISKPPPHATTHHYVNVPPSPRRGALYQRILGRGPYYLLKPSPSENPKPLATSSPPRSRLQQQLHIRHSGRTREQQEEPSTKCAHAKPEEDADESDSSSTEPPAVYTRDRLQKAIGRVRSGGLHVNGRPHSAPDLSSAGRSSTQDDSIFLDTNKRLYIKVKKSDEGRGHDEEPDELFQEKSEQFSTEQSPDSSSGFGSKNTSHQQSSSQSGQSASALGLDASRFETSAKSLPPAEVQSHPPPPPIPPAQAHLAPPSYNQWLSRKVLPQFRIPVDGTEFDGRPASLLMGVPRASPATGGPSRLYEYPSMGGPGPPQSFPVYQNVLDATEFNNAFMHTPPGVHHRTSLPRSIDSSSSITPLTITTSRFGETSPMVLKHPVRQPRQDHFARVALSQPPTLDISVDDHYEFDTLLSPTPGTAEDASPWSRSRTLSGGERGLSDSEIYGSGGRRKEAHESMEARVAAMKQEFHEYRQRQAKRRSNRELESVC